MKIHFRFLVAAVLAPAAVAQSLSGALVAGDTGAPIPRATIVAVQRTASISQRPNIYSAITNAGGQYAIAAPTGQYQLCVHGAEPYLDPCQWGAPIVRTSAAAAASVPLSLQRGANFIVRVHDPQGVLSPAEAVHGGSVRVNVSGGTFGRRAPAARL